MPGTFLGISTAVSALQSQQQALDTLSHNIANANTPGYKRQRVVMGEGNPISGAFASGYSARTAVGTGVHVEQILRVQNDFIDTRVRLASGQSAHWGARSDVLSQVEAVFNEPGDQGVGNELDKFWDAWDKLSAQPESIPNRLALVEQTQRLTERIRGAYAEFKRMAVDLDASITDKVTRINTITSEIADLNTKIGWANSGNVSPNDLLDKRDLLVGELTTLAGVEVSGQGGEDFMVTLGSKVLVQGATADQLGVNTGLNGKQEVYSLADGTVRPIPGGEIAGLLNVGDVAIPGFMAKLDGLATTLVSQVNALHATGRNLNGGLGGNFFNAGSTAANIEVSNAILASPRNIAASATGAVGNNAVALAIAELRNKTLPTGQTINQVYQAIVSEAGTQSALAKHYADTQSLSLQQFTAQQQSVSGVSLDEEMTDMIRFQQAYNAAARILTACDEMLSTLIQRTGLVGS